MMHSLKSFKKCTLLATDGDVGKITDMYFDDEQWGARYLVVDTGNWLSRHEVLVSPQSIDRADWDQGRIYLDMARERIEHCPGIDTRQPVSRRAEASLASHYGLPYYWSGGGGKPRFSDEQMRTIQHDVGLTGMEDSHLHSCNEVSGYAIGARDKRIGHVVDFLVDSDDWSIQYLVVDPRDLWPGNHVLMPVTRIEQVSWANHELVVDMTADDVRHCEEYDPDHLPASTGHRVGAGLSGQAPRPGV